MCSGAGSTDRSKAVVSRERPVWWKTERSDAPDIAAQLQLERGVQGR